MGDTPVKGILLALSVLCVVPAAKAQQQAVQCKADLEMWTGGFDSGTMLSDGWTISLPELVARTREMENCINSTVTGRGKRRKADYDGASEYMVEAAKYYLINDRRIRRYIMRHDEWETFEAGNVARYGEPVVAAAPLVQHAPTTGGCWQTLQSYQQHLKDILPFDTLQKRSVEMSRCFVLQAQEKKEALLAAGQNTSIDLNYISNSLGYREFAYANLGNFYEKAAGIELSDFLVQRREYNSFEAEDGTNRAVPKFTAGPDTTPIGEIVLPYDDLNGSMLVRISINGRKTTAILDSGADIVAANLNNFSIPADSRMDVEVADGRITSQNAGQAVVCAGTPEVCLRVTVSDTAADADVLLGQSFLSHFTKITVDRRQHEVVLEP
jgi:predicted aspartyl protease